MAKKVQYTTNDPSSTTDYLAADNTWKPMSGGGGGVPYTGATADVDLGTYKLFAGGVGIGTNTPAHELEVQSNDQCIILAQTSNATGGGMAMMDANTTNEFQVGVGAFADRLCLRSNSELFKFPTAQGTSGQAIVTDGSGNLSFATVGGGSSSSNFFIVGSATGLGAGLTRYGNIAGSTSESQVRLPLSSPCTISDLYVRTTATMNASASLKVSVFKNGTITAVTLTIAGGSAAGTYSDTTNSVSFVAGDGWTLGYTNAGSATAAATSGQSVKITI